ncbi:putative nuclease HARBI1 isoform X1 [Ixodes scapularis]
MWKGILRSKWLPIRNTSLFSATESKYFQGLGGKNQPIKARSLLFAAHGKCFQVSTAHKPAGASSFSFKVSTAYKQASTSSFFLKVEDDKVYQVYWAGDARTKGSFYDAKVLYMAELFFSPERLYREHRDAFELPEEIFRKQYRLPKIVVRWLCDELREEPEVRRVRTSWTVMTVELQVLCALRFYGTGSFQGMVASDEHVARDQKTVSVAVRAVSVAIVRRLGVQRGWIHFPETPSERFDAEKGFRLLGRIPGVIGCVDGTMVSIVGPSKNDPTVTKAAYWCRKYFYALNVMVVCDADCRIMCIDPRYPGSVHDSFVWQFSWLRNQLEQGQVPRDGRFLLGDSGYPLEPWLITPVPGNHATSTACGRFNKAHSSISAPQHLPCIERARTGVRLRP